jgi:hypothetical protein
METEGFYIAEDLDSLTITLPSSLFPRPHLVYRTDSSR